MYRCSDWALYSFGKDFGEISRLFDQDFGEASGPKSCKETGEESYISVKDVGLADERPLAKRVEQPPRAAAMPLSLGKWTSSSRNVQRDSLHTSEISRKIDHLGSKGGAIHASADDLFEAVDKDESGVISRSEVRQPRRLACHLPPPTRSLLGRPDRSLPPGRRH